MEPRWTAKENLARFLARQDQPKGAEELTRIEHRVGRYAKELQAAEAACREMVRQHPWIETERHAFGVAGGKYDFDKRKMGAVEKELAKKQTQLEALGKRINKKVLTMFDSAEHEYDDLVDKKQIVLKDKEKIEATIEQLAVKKIEALQQTWETVNKTFKSIFSTLLPGAQAKLEPQDGLPVEEGLIVRGATVLPHKQIEDSVRTPQIVI